jgi:flagellar motility protein MotE (MotC chaperone)
MAMTTLRLLPALMVCLSLLFGLRIATLVGDVATLAFSGAAPGMPVAAGSALLAITPAVAQERAALPGGPPAAPTSSVRNEVEQSTGFSASEIEILGALGRRRAELDSRARALAEREALLEAAEQRIAQKLEELRQIQASVAATLRHADEQDEARRKSLVRIFEGMKPQEAARILEQMELAQLVELIERMKERSASPILGQMHPVRARQVAAEIARRRQPAPSGPSAAPAAAPRAG